MKQRLKHPVFKFIAQAAQEKGLETYLVGGYVRDLILERKTKDIDIVTVGSGIDLATLVAEKLHMEGAIKVFKNFGTAQLKYQHTEIEFVGARRESYRYNSRKPVVEDGSLEDDQKRRDFTINALAISLNENNYEELLDPFDGLQDMAKKLIRTPREPNTTFSDDPLRMMRAIRFANQLYFRIDDKALTAIRENSQRIDIVSKERIADELNKIMLTKKPSVGWKLLDKTGLLPRILPEVAALKGVEIIDNVSHKDNFYHSLQVLDQLADKSDNLWLRWAALLHDVGKPPTKKFVDNKWTFHGHDYVGMKIIRRIFRNLRLPLNDKLKYVQKLVRLHLRPISLASHEVTDSAVRRLLFDAGDDVDDLMTLCEADITSKNEEKVQRFLDNFALVRKKLREIEAKDAVRNFQPPVSGEEIMETFGIKPSQVVGEIKEAIKNAILDGKIHNNHDEAYRYMLELGREHGLQPKK